MSEELKAHPIADLFPMLDGEQFKALAKSIKDNGLLEPIVLDRQKLILDGRNRYRACLSVGVRPHFITYEKDPVPYIVAKNIIRRHLTSKQRAALAAKALGYYTAEAEKRKAEGQKKGAKAEGKTGRPKKGESLEGKNSLKTSRAKPADKAVARAAKDFGTNAKYVAKAAKVEFSDPVLANKVASGEIDLDEAIEVISPSMKKEVDEKAELKAARSLRKSIVQMNKRIEGEHAKLVDIVASARDVPAESSEAAALKAEMKSLSGTATLVSELAMEAF